MENTIELFKNIIDNSKCSDEFSSSRYEFNGIKVPRVTEILSYTINEPYIAEWANWLGYKHKSYKATLGDAANVGTAVHNYIANVCQNKPVEEYSDDRILNCISAFNKWWNQLTSSNEVSIIGQEQKIVCPWFGGTYDMLLRVNDKVYLIDFKTSSKISFRYFLQLAAYKYMIEPYYNIHVDACMILRLDKKNAGFEEAIVDTNTSIGDSYITDCLNTFFSCVAYYNLRHKAEMCNIEQFIYKGDDDE